VIKGRIDRAHPYMYLSWRSGEDGSSIFWDNCSKGNIKK